LAAAGLRSWLLRQLVLGDQRADHGMVDGMTAYPQRACALTVEALAALEAGIDLDG
jgi:hypothetical protein